MVIRRDSANQPYIQWAQVSGGYKRAWLQHREGDKDWAGTGRYINVARCERSDGGPSGNATDFPVFNKLPDEQALIAFVQAVNAVTGCVPPDG